MSWLRTRRARVVAACAVQAALVPMAVYPALSARMLGDEYLLEVAPVDPIDPFRGAYVALSYPGLTQPEDLDPDRPAGEVFVPLEQDGAVWRPQPLRTDPPPEAPYLRCDSDGWRVQCGIESLFLPQDEAAAMERELGSGNAVARVRVDDRGNAAVVAVEAR